MTSSKSEQPEPVYLDLATESDDPSVTQLETLCMKCMEKGTTRLLLTLIPHFREVMISSFFCPHCHNSNSSLLNTGAVQDKGVKLTLAVNTQADLRRMIVKSDLASVKIPEVELEVPNGGEKGEITNVEGILCKVCEGLNMHQDERRRQNPDLADQIDVFLGKLTALTLLTTPFTIEINDPTGNSHIEGLNINGVTDPQLKIQHYERNDQLNEMMALAKEQKPDQDPLDQLTEEDEDSPGESDTLVAATIPADTPQEHSNRSQKQDNKTETIGTEKDDPSIGNTILPDTEEASGTTTNKVDDDSCTKDDIRQEVMQFSSLCEECHKPAETNMKLTVIPHFKEVIVMGTVCSHCGFRTSEVKSGGGISSTGRKICLTLDEVQLDMARDVLKSETCSVEVPELDLHVGAGILGGKFTTLEGLLLNIKEDLAKNPFFTGDSVEPERKATILTIFAKLDKILSGDMPATIVLDDPSGNSYLQNVYAPDPDPNMTVTDYTRTYEQNEELGLNDMKTEGYEKT